MPLYEYHCDECGKDFEQLTSFTQADNPQPCPGCGSSQTYKKISRPAILGGGSDSSSTGSSCRSGGGFT